MSSPLRMTTFNNQQASITHTVEVTVDMTDLTKDWVFLLAEQTPATIVIGLDLILAWPLFLNPLDRCLYLSPSSLSNDVDLYPQMEEIHEDIEDVLSVDEG